MKSCIALCLTVLCLAVVPARAAHRHAAKKPHIAKGDDAIPGKVIVEPESFHGIKWGTPMTAIPHLKVVEKAGDAVYATVSGEVYRLGDVFLNRLVYGFCQGKFAAVMVDYAGRAAHESIKKRLVAKYTRPVELDGKPDNLAWPLGRVLIRMEYSEDHKVGALSYFNRPLYAPCVAASPDAADATAKKTGNKP